MKSLLNIIAILVLFFLVSSCEKQGTCPCPSVFLDTQSIKFEKNISISVGFPTPSQNAPIVGSGWTRNGNLDTVRSYFAIPSLDTIDAKYMIKKAYFVWYGELTLFSDDRIDDDTSFIYLTNVPKNTILNITWQKQPTVLTNTKIPVVPPYHRIGMVKIDATDVINKIRNGTLSNNVFLFRLKTELPYRQKSYKGLNTNTPEEAPALELVLEKPVE
jgi:hypothetical protein